MSEFKGTPGKWDRIGLTVIGQHIKGDGRNRVVARCEHAPGTYLLEAIANARLIAAAPDLLEAAKKARHALSELIASGDRVVFADALAALDSAIAKVEG